jgi:hypothetical protein
MNLPFRRVSTVTVPPAGAAAVPAGGPSAAAAAGPAVNEREYGLYAIVAGLLVLVGLDGAALAVLSHNVNGAVAVIGAVSAPVVAMVSAYFGIKVGGRSGSASAAAADRARQGADHARQQAETAVTSLLGHMTPDQAIPVMRKLGIPVVDDDAPPGAAA